MERKKQKTVLEEEMSQIFLTHTEACLRLIVAFKLQKVVICDN